MRVGQHITLRSIDDNPGAGRLGLALDRLSLHIEKAPKHGILQQWVVFADPAAHRDADNTRGYPAHHRRDAMERRATHFRDRRARKGRTWGAVHQSDPA